MPTSTSSWRRRREERACWRDVCACVHGAGVRKILVDFARARAHGRAPKHDPRPRTIPIQHQTHPQAHSQGPQGIHVALCVKSQSR